MSARELAQHCANFMLANDRASRELGMTIEIPEAGSARVRMEVRETMVNGLGVCHGGYIFTLADSAFAFACNGHDRVTLAAGASIEFVRAARLGDRLQADASERHRGRNSGIYDVTIINQEGRLVALFRGRAHVTRDTVISPGPEAPV